MPDINSGLRRAANALKSVDWVVPAYVSVGVISNLGCRIENADPVEKQAILKSFLPQIYSDDNLAAKLVGLYSVTIFVRDFRKPIAEAIEAGLTGLPHAAVCTLIPVLEGVFKKISVERDGLSKKGNTPWLRAELDELLAKEERSPSRYEERIVMLESFREFYVNRFTSSTNCYEGLDQLNRHGILHGIFEGYGDNVNFFRLVSLLDLLCFALALSHGGSCFSPEYTNESRALASFFRAAREQSALRPEWDTNDI
ncbi:hypothetical protein RO575_20660 [Methylomonas sp. MO1]|uniref:hypothetical protein n=1 Tax=unclassified Methylomonas TaxID=2608980 RepID=UPI00047EC534|nr:MULTISPECIES: hypothetical protein [unclassified Methylomonas]MDT4291982.1 hypothetical protein [Methylomonas sp. MO1]